MNYRSTCIHNNEIYWTSIEKWFAWNYIGDNYRDDKLYFLRELNLLDII